MGFEVFSCKNLFIIKSFVAKLFWPERFKAAEANLSSLTQYLSRYKIPYVSLYTFIHIDFKLST